MPIVREPIGRRLFIDNSMPKETRVSETSTYLELNQLFQFAISDYRPPLPRRQVTFFTWFSHALFSLGRPYLSVVKVRTLSSSVPTKRNQNRRSFICTATMSGLFAKSSLFFCVWNSIFLWLRSTRHAHHSLRLYSLRNQEQSTRSAKHPHLSAHAPSNVSDILWGMVI